MDRKANDGLMIIDNDNDNNVYIVKLLKVNVKMYMIVC